MNFTSTYCKIVCQFLNDHPKVGSYVEKLYKNPYLGRQPFKGFGFCTLVILCSNTGNITRDNYFIGLLLIHNVKQN